jgi:hypothetical protein
MRSRALFLFLFLGWVSVSFADEDVTHSNVTHYNPATYIYIARTGMQFQAPHVWTYHLLEYAEQRGRWIIPDLGVYDCGNYRELFIGGGPVYHHGKIATLTQELFFAQDTGAAAHGARYLWIWPVTDFQFTPRLSAEAVVVPCLPLNRAARIQYDFDRAKLEYALDRRFTLGGGYSASKYASDAWLSKPFLTTTVSSRLGAFEFWLQKTPGGGQIQMRYQLVHAAR